MKHEDLTRRLKEKLGTAAVWINPEAGDCFMRVEYSIWRETCSRLLVDAVCPFSFLRSLTGTDYPEEGGIELTAHLFNMEHKYALTIKTGLDREKPVCESLCTVWPAANWYEREIFDLLGVKFSGHPELRRLLMPDDWQGHPLRKDYQSPSEYRGIPAARPS